MVLTTTTFLSSNTLNVVKKQITDSLIGPFFFGGTLFDLLGAENVMHQDFLPKSDKYQFGQFTMLFDKNKYLFIISLHNGFMEDHNDKARWQAFRFNQNSITLKDV